MSQSNIVIRGAREHNLKGVDLTLPRESLITVTGVSGSGKSSLAFDTIFQEGQRRFLESLSSYARQYVGKLEKPKVESITGLSPTISIDQKTVNRNPRSTVGTITEVYDYLRLLFARLGTPHCVQCGRELKAQTADQIVATLLADHPGERCLVLAPVVRGRKGHYRKELAAWRRKGFVRARIDGEVRRLDESIELSRYQLHTIELVLDRITLEEDRKSRLAEAVESALRLGDGQVSFLIADERLREFSSTLSCPQCGTGLPEFEPRLFSFNSPNGACASCNGLGSFRNVDPQKVVPDASLSLDEGALKIMTKTGYLPYVRLGKSALASLARRYGFRLDAPWKSLPAAIRKLLLYGSGGEAVSVSFEYKSSSSDFTIKGKDHRPLQGLIPAMEETWKFSHPRHLEKFLSEMTCRQCQGRRLRPEALAVKFRGRAIDEFAALTIEECVQFFQELKFTASEALIGDGILREIRSRLRFLLEVGLSYLKLERSAATLSGGEAQRVRLATQVGAGLQGVLYVLDEPSIGLHPRDHHRLLDTLRELKHRRNTVLVVEHDRDTMLSSDWLVDVGPGAGRLGGEIVADGPIREVYNNPSSLTARYLRGDERIPVPERRRPGNGKVLRIEGAEHFNLQNIDVDIPLGTLVGVSGVSGSGKSTLVHLILARELARQLHDAEAPAGKHRALRGIEHLDKVIEISQTPIGKTPRSNPATYTGVWDHIRDLFAQVPEAKARGYTKSRFSFNVKGGRCESCQGAGVRTLEMQFLADVAIPCEECGGRRFNRETLEIQYGGRNVQQVLELTVREALDLFENVPNVRRILQTLVDVGLDYAALGQSSTTLSGGEAQRIKLAAELSRPSTGRTLYLLDEPTTGLHFADIQKLIRTLSELTDRGNTVLVIEHNLDVLLACDQLIDLGPEGGSGGGCLVAAGTPEEVMRVRRSHTARFLKLAVKPSAPSFPEVTAKSNESNRDNELVIAGARKNNLAGIDARIPHERLTVVTGVSGSGKTSFAFDTVFAEGQRRFVESLSTYARRFFSRMERAPVDRMEGLRPAIAIDQKAGARNPRSTVATSTEIYDHLRLLYARVGIPHCPVCNKRLETHTPSTAAAALVQQASGKKVHVLAPMFRKGSARVLELSSAKELAEKIPELRREGFVRVLVDGEERRLEEDAGRLSSAKHSIDLVLDRMRVDLPQRTRLAEALEEALRRGRGIALARLEDGTVFRFCSRVACDDCGYYRSEELTPRHFSFNHTVGACPDCQGLGRSRRAQEDRVIRRPSRSLLHGAMEETPGNWFLRKGSILRAALEGAARELGMDLEQPYSSFTRKQKEGLLRGVGVAERVSSQIKRSGAGRQREYTFQARFRGILAEIEHWIHQEEAGKWWVDRLLPLTEEGPCPTCGGGRLRREALATRIGGLGIQEATALTVRGGHEFFGALALSERDAAVAEQPLHEIRGRLRFLCDVGLEYLTLDRASSSLSGGEAQRIRLATQLGSGLVGVLYVLDEPSIGLHPRDTRRLIDTLMGLRDLGNTLLVVEHDEEMIRAADHLLDLGPGAGIHGGRLIAEGTVAEVERHPRSLTGHYLSGRRRIEAPPTRRTPSGVLGIRGANLHNLKDLDVDVPLSTLAVVTGVSGSGKSTLVMDVLQENIQKELLAQRRAFTGCKRITGLDWIQSLVVIDQSPIGTTPSSNPATYTKVFDPIREVFASTPEAKMKGFSRNRFSFNQGDGRCHACQGRGAVLVEMHFLSDLWVPCEACRSRRYNEETLAVRYKQRSIADVLDMEVLEALEFFENYRRITRILQVLTDVGLGYLKLGQSSTTLSGGEAQRVKLAAELARSTSGRTLYLLDEPTTGLHFADVEKLIQVLHRLVDRGGSVIVIEHQLDVIACADQVIDLGPEGGNSGGALVAAGTPEQVASVPGSHTGKALRRWLDSARRAAAQPLPVGGAA